MGWLGATVLSLEASAQTWLGVTNNYNSPTNWTGGTVPAGFSDTATFSAAGAAAVSLPGDVLVGQFVFDNAAQSYTFSFGNPSTNLRFAGAGIVNNSGRAQTLVGENTTGFTFLDTATSADTTISLSNSLVTYTNGANAGTSSISATNGGFVSVRFTANLAAATIDLADGSQLVMQEQASGGTAAVTMSASTIDITGLTAAGTSIGSVAGPSGQILLGSKQFTVGGNNASTTFGGTISGVGGSIIKTGSGTWTLTGTNTYTGGTTVSAGTLRGTTSSLPGDIVNNATLAFSQSGDGSHTGTISGTGSLVKEGAGRVTLLGANTYQGGTTINGGTLGINNASALGTGAVSLSGGNLTGVANLTLANDINFTAGTGIIAATTGTTLTLTPSTLGFTFVPNTVMTFGSSADAGTVVYAAALSVITNIPFSTVVSGGTLRAGAVSFGTLTGNDRATTVVNAGATLDFNDFSSTVANLQGVGSVLTGASAATTIVIREGNFSGTIGGAGQLTKTGTGTLVLSGANTYSGGTTVSGGILQGTSTSLQGAITNNANVTFNQGFSGTYAGAMSGSGSLIKSGTGTLVLAGSNNYSGGTTVSGGVLQGNAASLQGNILNNGSVVFDQATNGTYAGTMSGAGMLTKSGAGTLILGGGNSYSGGTLVSAGILQGTTSSLQGIIVNNATVAFSQAGSGTYDGSMSGTGSLLVNGTGIVILSGTNSYTGGTTVSGGVLQGNTDSLQGGILNNASVVFNQTGSGTYAGNMSGTGSMTLQGGGILGMTGTSAYTGPTTVNAGTLIVNGLLASTVTLSNGTTLGGAGTIGGLVSNAGILAPGNSIGTLTVTRNFTQTGGTYQVEANAAGQSDRVNITGTATVNGGTVQVLAASGSYANSTTYTILNATGGISGTYTGVSSNFAFLTPSLTYDPNNVFLTLALQGNAFSGFGGNTVNQRAVGYALDQSYASATGDFATVVGALAGLNTQQGPYALNQISGQPYADFGTFNVANNALFMNALGQQMALARGGAGSGQRQALAQACDVEACDAASPFSVWGSLLGGLGSVQGDGNSSTFTYNVGGAAAGIDYRLTPSVLIGLSAAYTNGTQWVDSFQGKGWSNTVSVAAYASFTQSAFYVDALAGYAYSNNQLQRQISIPNLQPRTANGSTGANQFLAQVEAGYAVPVYAPAAATVTPFARFQTSSINQAAFNEWGANSLSLNVAQQTTTSVRTTLGADLAAVIGNVDLGLRLGWLHEYANTARPVSAAFAGAPSASFTVYGATPQRDAAVIGFQASATVAEAQIFLRYDGEIAAGSDNHTLNVGLRLSW
jgi:autotransporter-associated beta strand protein